MIKEFLASILTGLTGLAGGAGQIPTDTDAQTFNPPQHVAEQFQNHQAGRIGAMQKLELPENWQEMSDEEKQAWKQEQRGLVHTKPELPENWQEMSDEEKGAWFQEQGIERPNKKRPELPEGWQEMSDEEKEALKTEKLEERLGVALPENWSEMEREERHAFIQENAPEDFQPQRKRGKKNGQGLQPHVTDDYQPLDVQF